jgi:protein-S-isoprenylcysteine O-methyltransferase Ste14
LEQDVNKPKNALVTLAFVAFGAPGMVGVYVPAWITRWHVAAGAWRVPVAFALIALGAVPLAESIVRFVRVGRGTLSPTHPTEFLVANGLYRYVRNPMYLGMLAIIAGQVILFGSGTLLEYLGFVSVSFHLFVVLYEEPTRRKKYGASYEEFCRGVPRWLPRFRTR